MHNNRRHKPIFCFDFDGTLLNENEQIHPEDLHYLKRKCLYSGSRHRAHTGFRKASPGKERFVQR